MRAVIQRVSKASVTVEGRVTGSIGAGLAVLIGIAPDDGAEDIDFMVRKLLNLRIFPDKDGRFDLSLSDIGGAVLLVSQFTLFGDCRKGNRPSFSRAADPEAAELIYESMIMKLEETGIIVSSGIFGAHMEVNIVNDGPVTLILDSRKRIY